MSPIGSAAKVGVLDPGSPNYDADGSLPGFLPWVIAGAWLLTILAWTEGWGRALGHDHLIEHGPGLWPALGLFLGGWVVMSAAMMLPSSLPAFRWFDGLTAGQSDRQGLVAAFLAGYVAVWTGFGAVAFLGDIGFHRFVDGWSWLAARPWLIGGTVLVLAGAFELSPLAGRCGWRAAQLSGRLGGHRRLVDSFAWERIMLCGGSAGAGPSCCCLSRSVWPASVGWWR